MGLSKGDLTSEVTVRRGSTVCPGVPSPIPTPHAVWRLWKMSLPSVRVRAAACACG